MKTYGVIMAGGGGTRFWPLSRQTIPKQLLNLSGKDLMINETIDRLQSIIDNENIFIVTSAQQSDLMIASIGGRLKDDHILREPAARNTAACIGYTAVDILKRYGDGIMCVFPADHHITDEDTFRCVITKAIRYAESANQLVTIGIKPMYPATGFGYIRYDNHQTGPIKSVLQFREKPDIETAKGYVDSGEYAWNSGMFIWKASVILDKFKQLLPDIYADLMMLHNAIGTDQENQVLQTVYPSIRKISIDYGIMERCDNVVVIPSDFGWNDVGSWDMMHILHQKDDDGNILIGDTTCIDTTNAVLYSSGRHVVVIDMDDIVVVETLDAVMVCKQSMAQNVKLAVEKLKKNKRFELL